MKIRRLFLSDANVLCDGNETRHAHTQKLIKHEVRHRERMSKTCCKTMMMKMMTVIDNVINVWNGLPSNTDFSCLTSFEHTIEMIDFSQLLRYE